MNKTIELICCSRYPELFEKMRRSAIDTANGPILVTKMQDDGEMRIAASYNLMGAISKADILLFVHDDIQFSSKGWDDIVREGIGFGFDVLGVVGTQKYEGGLIFDSGRKYSCGKHVGVYDGKRVVKLMENRAALEEVAVVDGMFMAVKRDHFNKIDGFDYQFNGLFYWDLDLCLRSKCAVIDILVAHEKPEDLRGQYPAHMKPREYYLENFNRKHGFASDPPIGDQGCSAIPFEDWKDGMVIA